MALAIVLLLISSAITISIPFSMGKILDLVSQSRIQEHSTSMDDRTASWWDRLASAVHELREGRPSFAIIFSGLLVLFTIGAAANMTRLVLMRIAAERTVMRLRRLIFDNIMHQDLSFHDQNRTGELISRLSADTVVVGKTITNNISDGMRNLTMASVGVGIMMYTNPNLTGIMMLIIPPAAGAAIYYGRIVRNLSKQTQNAISETTKVSEEKIGKMRTVRAFSQENREVARYGDAIQNVYDIALRDGRATAVFYAGMMYSGNLLMLALLYFGGQMAQANEITVGELISFSMYTVYVGGAMVGLTSFFSEIMKGLGASTRLFTLLERPRNIEQATGITLPAVRGRVRIEDLTFAYPTRPDTDVFRGMCLDIPAGMSLSFVGTSGSGKSSIAQLLLRFYDPQSGRITLDGHDLRTLNPSWLRRDVIGYVPQEPSLFAASIRDNIAYGVPDATPEAIEHAARLACAHDFIMQFPDGYDTMIGENSVGLSGGQKQRIAIARALLKNPTILVMDEATSALSSTDEALIAQGLAQAARGRTTITITHRLQSVTDKHAVVVVDGGRAVEFDEPYKLLQNPEGAFSQLVANMGPEAAKKLRELCQLAHDRRVAAAAREAATSTSPSPSPSPSPAQAPAMSPAA